MAKRQTLTVADYAQRQLTEQERQMLVASRLEQLRQIEIDQLARQQLEQERAQQLAAEQEKATKAERQAADKRRADNLAQLTNAVDAYVADVESFQGAAVAVVNMFTELAQRQAELYEQGASLGGSLISFFGAHSNELPAAEMAAILGQLQARLCSPDLNVDFGRAQFTNSSPQQRAGVFVRRQSPTGRTPWHQL